MKKFMMLCLVFLVLTGLAFSAGQEASENTMSHDESVSHEILWIAGFWNNEPDPDRLIISEIEKMNNIKLDIQWVPANPLKEKTRVLINAGDFPDVLTIAEKWNQFPEYNEWAKQGVFLDLKPYFETYGPNILAERDREDWLEGPGVIDGEETGKYFGVLTSTNDPINNVWMVRKDWLDKFGLGIPQDMDDLVEYWKKVTFEDPDGDGKDNTYGTHYSNNIEDGWMLEPYFQAFSIQTPHPVLIDGKYYPYFFHENFQEAIAFMNELWNMGLVSPESIAQRVNDSRKAFANGKLGTVYTGVGSLAGRTESIQKHTPSGEVIILEPVPGLDGVRVYNEQQNFKRSNVIFTPVAEVPGKVERIVSMWNWWLEEDVMDMLLWGFEGTHWEMKDGIRQVTEKFETDNLGNLRQLMQPKHGKIISPKNTYGINKINYEIAQGFSDHLRDSYLKHNPYLGRAKTEAEKAGLEFESYAKTFIAQFIIGELPINEESIEQVRQEWLRKGGQQFVDEFTPIMQRAEALHSK